MRTATRLDSAGERSTDYPQTDPRTYIYPREIKLAAPAIARQDEQFGTLPLGQIDERESSIARLEGSIKPPPERNKDQKRR